jgi:membrane protease YdiL (CAAX protease family)
VRLIDRTLPVAALVSGAVVCALLAPALAHVASATVIDSFAGSVSLVPLLLVMVLGWRRLRPPESSIGRSFGRSCAVVAVGPAMAVVLGLTAGTAPVLPHPLVAGEIIGLAALEEVLFRGVLLILALRLGARLLPPPANVVVSVLVLSLAFAAAHPDSTPLMAAERVWFGVLASALVLHAGRLRLAIALHAAFNLYAYLALSLVPPPVVTGVGMAWTSAVTAALLLSSRPGARSGPLSPARVGAPEDRRRSTGPRG